MNRRYGELNVYDDALPSSYLGSFSDLLYSDPSLLIILFDSSFHGLIALIMSKSTGLIGKWVIVQRPDF